MEWISVEDCMPEFGQHVRTKDLSGREFNCLTDSKSFKIAGYVWDHENATHWTPIEDAFNGIKNNWRGNN